MQQMAKAACRMVALPPRAIVYHFSASTHLLLTEQHLADAYLRGDASKTCCYHGFSVLVVYYLFICLPIYFFLPI